MQLSEKELELYSRNFLVSGWGLSQQLALKKSTVIIRHKDDLLVKYLVAVGVGRIAYKYNKTLKKLNPYLDLVEHEQITPSKQTFLIEKFSENKELRDKITYRNIQIIRVKKHESSIKSSLLTAINCIDLITNTS